MQYILSEEEFQALRDTKLKVTENAKKVLQEVCTKAANEWSIKFWNNPEAEPWGCILNVKHEWYCDECPMQDICPNDNKEWSK